MTRLRLSGQLFRLLLLCLPISASLLVVTPPADAAPAVAFVSRQFIYLEDYDVVEDFREAGFEVGALAWKAVSADTLKPFNAIVLTDIPGANEQGELPEAIRAAVQAIHAYAQAGGGVLACMGAGGWDRSRVAANVVLEPWDLQLLDEQVTDPVNLYRQTRYIRWWFSWTTNITPAPATAGVSTVFYPSKSWRADGQKTVYALQPGDDWQVLVRGEKTTRSVETIPKTGEMQTEPATWPSEPPIAAAREVGEGRVAAFALWPNWTFWGARRKPIEGIVWESGANGIPSDTGRFLVQLVSWLAEPSTQSGAFGGYVTPDEPEPRPEQYPAHAIDWAGATYPEAAPREHWRVLAGARTSLTGGSGTVAQYCEAARAAGYRAVLFAERLDQLTPGGWDGLREECLDQSSDDFLALPGIDFETLQGDQYVAFGKFDFPKPPGLAADGKHIDDTYNLWGSQMHMGFIATTRLHSHPERDPQILKNMVACAVQTWEDGTLIDDSLDHYLALDAQYHNMVPLSLHLLKSPSEVAGAAQMGLQNVWQVRDAADLEEQITPQAQANVTYWRNPHGTYLTSGPRLEAWDGINIFYWGLPAEGSRFWKIRLSVNSEANMSEVKVLDRGADYLRFAGDGQTISHEFPGLADSQHVFHLVARDDAGGLLISSNIRIRFSDAWIIQCGDHQNTISACLQQNEKGRSVYTSGTTASAYAGWEPRWSAPCPVDPTADYPPFWDGIATGSAGWAGPIAYIEGGIKEGGRELAATNLYAVAGPEVQILEQVAASKYPEGTPDRRDCSPTYRTVPNEYVATTLRRVTPTAAFGRAGLSFNELTVTALRDFSFDPEVRVGLHGFAFSDYASRPDGIGDHFLATFADGRVISRVGPPGASPVHPHGEMELGNYVAAYPNPNGAGAIFPLDPMSVRITMTEKLFAALFGLPVGGTAMRRGDSLVMRFMAVSAPTSLEEGNQVFDDIRRTLGLGCEPAYAVTPSQGQVEGATGYLTVAAERGAFAAHLTKTTMPTALFLNARGLTDGWSCAKQVNGGPLTPVTVLQGVGYTNVDLNASDVDVVVGHPVLCDAAGLKVVAWVTGAGIEVFAQNPGEEDITCELSSNPAFDGLPPVAETVTVMAGGSISLNWPAGP